MTDTDIIKAAIESINDVLSSECCTEYGKQYCRETIASLAWDLIDRYESEIERLETEIKKLKLEMSYMSSPNTIGDCHEMGGW